MGVVDGVHALGEGAEVVIEEAGVDVEGHRRGGVTDHPLDRFDVGAGGDEKTRGGVPEVVGTEILQSRCSSGRIEDASPEVAGPENAAPG